MTARERINALVDADKPNLEIGMMAHTILESTQEVCDASGVVVVVAYVSGHPCVVVANDAMIKAGAWFPMTAKKNLRAQEIALINKIPIVYLVDSAGIFLPQQNDVFADQDHFGRVFRNNAVMSAQGITQIAVVMGSCVAGGAYLPAMSDEIIMVQDSGTIFLAGPHLVKAAIGETIDEQLLGGAQTHAELSGLADYVAKDELDALKRVRKTMGMMSFNPNGYFNRISPKYPSLAPELIYHNLPNSRTEAYDMQLILNSMVDEDSFEPYKPDFGQTIICGYARIDGWAVGVVANQRLTVKSKRGEMQMGGVIYSDSATKAARFIAMCNQKGLPLVFFQDVNGFMVGSKSEHNGIIKDGAQMVSAMANSVVPKFTIIVGNAYGAGYYAMCGKAYDPRFIVAWPTAKIGVMGGQQAAKVLLQIQTNSQEMLDDATKKERLAEIEAKYDRELSPYYAAQQLWVDAIIDPIQTRQWISTGIDITQHNPLDKFNIGLTQM
ncbi:unnamed protein product [Notodromas monacha]|uniref:methylcrotonoyl-CoA carboxylase n=1 Tax=Notodromas monacha TaxID=399045 RepID=A0A7R9C269_9CRUS|nr:unnamed protein product [Notodromas monacha]CAG0924745.1 unnamed protein product [Notodromas monacha]